LTNSEGTIFIFNSNGGVCTIMFNEFDIKINNQGKNQVSFEGDINQNLNNNNNGKRRITLNVKPKSLVEDKIYNNMNFNKL
jgi:hypothetical protein